MADDQIPDDLLNQSECASALNVTEPTLRKWIKAGAPVYRGGKNGVPYELSVSAVATWVKEQQRSDDEERARRERVIETSASLFGEDELIDPTTEPRVLRQIFAAMKDLDTLRTQRGLLFERGPVVRLFEGSCSLLSEGMTALQRRLLRDLDLAPDQKALLRRAFDQERINISEQLEHLCTGVEPSQLDGSIAMGTPGAANGTALRHAIGHFEDGEPVDPGVAQPVDPGSSAALPAG